MTQPVPYSFKSDLGSKLDFPQFSSTNNQIIRTNSLLRPYWLLRARKVVWESAPVRFDKIDTQSRALLEYDLFQATVASFLARNL